MLTEACGDSWQKCDSDNIRDTVENSVKLRTEIAKTEAKEKVYEEFNVVEEEVPDHPRKFTLFLMLSLVKCLKGLRSL